MGLWRARGIGHKGDSREEEETRVGQGEGVGYLEGWVCEWRVSY